MFLRETVYGSVTELGKHLWGPLGGSQKQPEGYPEQIQEPGSQNRHQPHEEDQSDSMTKLSWNSTCVEPDPQDDQNGYNYR